MSSRKQRVFVVSEQPLCRHGMTQIINSEADLVVCGEAASLRQAPAAVRAAKADLVLMDLPPGEVDGPELLKRLRGDKAELPIIVVSSARDSQAVLALLRAGA